LDVDPDYFANTNIMELHLLEVSPSWWNKFVPPRKLEIIECCYSDLPDICNRVKLLPGCLLTQVGLAVKVSFGTFGEYADGNILSWVYSDTINPKQILNKDRKRRCFTFPLHEFNEVNRALRGNYLNKISRFRVEM
jgi:hypothetical protein